jgi:APA family basic amino acid/polyamine antiporter
LVVANTIGTGVFLSAGFMAQDLGPLAILLAWVAGAALAMCGAVAYAENARLLPQSGGEYRYLSTLVHPAVGSTAGWASMLAGFSGPMAINAMFAGAFAQRVIPRLEPRVFAGALIVGITLVHAFSLRVSRLGQNLLVIAKAVLVAGFVVLGLWLGSWQWPTWVPPHHPEGFALLPFVTSQFYVAYAFSGWNAAIYSAEDFAHPTRDVPRAMVWGCAAIGAAYLLVNWIFVANLTPASAAVVTETQDVTLAHVIAQELVGATGAVLISAFLVIVFISTTSALGFMGPRVYAEMAKDGLLPRWLGSRGDHRPPTASVLLQGGLSLVLVFTQSLRGILQDVGAVLVLFAALTAAALFRVRRVLGTPPSRLSRVAAVVYALAAVWMLYYGLSQQSQLWAWLLGLTIAGVGSSVVTRALARRAERRGPEHRHP